MRITLNLDDDVLQVVEERAKREHRTAGDVLSDLARQVLATTPEAHQPKYGFRPLPSRGGIVSNDLIDQIRDESE